MINKKFILGIASLFLFFNMAGIYSFGVESSYFSGNEFLIAPGEVRTAELVLQNLLEGAEDVRIKVVMIRDEGIASVVEQVYLVRAQTRDTSIPITIRIPEEAPLGTAYNVIVGFETVSGGGGEGAVSFTTGYETKIPILVVDASLTPKELAQEKEIPYKYLIGALVIILIALIVWWIIKRKRKM